MPPVWSRAAKGRPPLKGSPAWRTPGVTPELGGVLRLGVRIGWGFVSRARMRRGKERVGYPQLSPWRGQREGWWEVPWRHARNRVGHCRAPRRERQGKGQLLPLRLGLWLRTRREQGRWRALVQEEQGQGTFYLARPRREGQGHLDFEPQNLSVTQQESCVRILRSEADS